MAISTAKKLIPDALNDLNNVIKNASQLQNSGIELFTDHAKELLEIIGPKAADFAKQKEDVAYEIDKLEKKYCEIVDELGVQKAEMERYSHLITATQIRLNGNEAAMNETRARAAQMHSLNQEADNAIRAIPDTITQSYTTSSRSWWWGRRRTTTHYVS